MLGNVVVLAVVYLIAIGSRTEAFNPYVLIGTLAAIWAVAAGGLLFQSVGIWRAAQRYRRERLSEHKTAPWALAAQAMVLIWVVGLVVPLAGSGVPQLSEAWRMAFLGDPGIPDYSLRLMRDGTEAEVTGGFKYGLAHDAARLFAKAPALKVVHLNSGGGRLGEAERLGRLIRERHLDTYTSASCSSACTVAFLAGRERWLKAGARLGFHHESFAGSEKFDSMRKLLVTAGVPATFAQRAVSASSGTMWYPTVAELMDAHVITGIADNYRFAASGFGVRPDAQSFEMQLRRTPLFDAIAANEPASFQMIVDSLYRSYFAGIPEGRIMDELRTSKVAPLILARMAYADDQLLADYAALMADQYEAVGRRDPAACFHYAAGGASGNLAGLLPDSLKDREMALSEAVLRSTERRKSSSSEPSIEATYRAVHEKLAHQFGTEVRLLADPSKVTPSQYASYCSLAVAMFRAISTLPRQQAGAVMSQIFSNMQTSKSWLE